MIVSFIIFFFQVLGSTLILTWIPNTTLKQNPRSIENSPSRISPCRSPKQDYAHTPTSPSNDLSAELAYKNEHSSLKEISEENIDSMVSGINNIVSSSSSGYSTEYSRSASDKSHIFDDISSLSLDDTKQNEQYDRAVKVVESDSSQEDVKLKQQSSFTSSDSSPTEINLFFQAKKRGDILKERYKMLRTEKRSSSGASERHSSSVTSIGSVTSIEMEGDNLRIVTEMDENDEAFLVQNNSMSTDSCKSEYLHSDTLEKGCSETYSSSQNKRTSLNKLANELVLTEENIKGVLSPNRSEENIEYHTISDNDCLIKHDITPRPIDLSLNLDNVSNSSVPNSPCSSSTSGPDTPTDSSSSFSVPSSASLTELSSVVAPGLLYQPSVKVTDIDSHVMSHDLRFPQNSVSSNSTSTTDSHHTAKEQLCGVFSVDLGESL